MVWMLLEQFVAVIKELTPNVFGDAAVILKVSNQHLLVVYMGRVEIQRCL